MTKEAVESLISGLELWALIFGAVVVIGVGGESVFGVRIWWNNRKLHKLEQTENDDLRLKVRQADERSSKAEAEAEGFRLQIADANERAANAELAEKELEVSIQPRDLTIAQQRAIGDACRTFSGSSVVLRSYGLDLEGARLGKLIVAALRFGGLNVIDDTASLLPLGGGNFSTGVHVSGPPEYKGLADTIRSALSTTGKLKVSAEPVLVADKVMVFVGLKPLPEVKPLARN